MNDLKIPSKANTKTQNNIDIFESLSLVQNGVQRYKSNKKLPGAIIEIETIEENESVLTAIASNQSNTLLQPGIPVATSESNVRKLDSAVFLQQSYLKGSTPTSLPEDAREILKGQPCLEDVKTVLKYLQCGIDGIHDFNIKITSPAAAQIVHILVTATIPDLWTTLSATELSSSENEIRSTILQCMSSVAGIGALLSQIKQLCTAAKQTSNVLLLHAAIDVLANVLNGYDRVSRFLDETPILYKRDVQRRLLWQELTALLAGSKVLNITSQACVIIKDLSPSISSCSWVGDGVAYSKWAGRNVAKAMAKSDSYGAESWTYVVQFTKRALNIGHRDVFVNQLYSSFLLGSHALWTPLHRLMTQLSVYEQKMIFDAILTDLTKKYFEDGSSSNMLNVSSQSTKKIAGVAAMVSGLVKNNEVLEAHMVEWLTASNNAHINIGIRTRRALLAVLARSEDKLLDVLEKTLTNLGDKLVIRHASIVQQETMAQTALMAIGYMHRINPERLKQSSISSLVMHTVSNRLSASIPRARFLGMLIGVSVSRLVDKPDRVMNFDVEKMETDEAQDWLSLPDTTDTVGTLSDLQIPTPNDEQPKIRVKRVNNMKPSIPTIKPISTSRIVAIEEVSSSSDDEDDLVPHSKPDDDPDDSDEDPTLVNRSRPTAPVYIIDLIKQLQLNDKPDITRLALRTAPTLIRRKATFGTELADNIHSLVSALVNLQEGLSEHELQKLRLDSVIACLAAQAEIVGNYLATIFFEGDFSLSQRIILLTAIGLGTRELAGCKDSTDDIVTPDFPSNRLPAHLQPSKQTPKPENLSLPISKLAAAQAYKTIQPMALAAADQQTGPSVLKIRTFSSRLDVEKRKHDTQVQRTKRIPKNLHSLLANRIYLPLCTRMSLVLSSKAANFNTTLLHTSTFRLFLQTLTLVLSTLGPSAVPHLPILTHETLLLLLTLHNTRIATDPTVLPALLHLLLSLIDLTIEAGVIMQETLIVEHGVQVAELVSWANGLNDQGNIPITSGDGMEEGMPWTVLAAGIQVKWFEMGKRFQGRMFGLMPGQEIDGF